jgi:phenolic acid decarboxylase
MTDFAFAGKTFEVRVDNGVIFQNTYADEGNKLRYEEIDGAVEGASEEVRLHVAEVASGIYLLGWNEVSGTAVTHVMDFNTNTITAFWSFDVGGGRIGEVHTATFKEVR